MDSKYYLTIDDIKAIHDTHNQRISYMLEPYTLLEFRHDGMYIYYNQVGYSHQYMTRVGEFQQRTKKVQGKYLILLYTQLRGIP